jgi:hypothetical protein
VRGGSESEFACSCCHSSVTQRNAQAFGSVVLIQGV